MLRKTDKNEFLSLLEDESNLKGGYADFAVFPKDEKEVSDFLKEANSAGMPVTISGAGTGLTGARIPFGGAVVSCQMLNKIPEIDKNKKAAILQCGVSWASLKDALDNNNLWFGPNPTEEKAFIGSAVSTNASGGRSFKYGSVRNLVTRLKVILANGNEMDIRRGEVFCKGDKFAVPSYTMPSVKNSAGYFVRKPLDLIDLFIGQEGTLGFISEIELALLNKPHKLLGFFVFFDHEDVLLNFVGELKIISREGFSRQEHANADIEACSIEYFDKNSLDILRKDYPNLPQGRSALFIEQEIYKDKEDSVVNSWINFLGRYRISADDVWFADTAKDEKTFEEIRHRLPEAINEIIKSHKITKVATDIAVPDKAFAGMFAFYNDRLNNCGTRYVIFGHISDNHLHVNILPKVNDDINKARAIAMEFVQKAVSLGGTVSAEHGIGKLKREFLQVMYGDKAIREMVALKKSFDPKGILNQGNIFPKEFLG